MYTYKDFGTKKIRRTRGEFSYWSRATGQMNARYAVFQNPKGTVNVPCYLLTKETIARIPPMPKPIPEYPDFDLESHSYSFSSWGKTHWYCYPPLMNTLFQDVAQCDLDFEVYKQAMNSPWSEWIDGPLLAISKEGNMCTVAQFNFDIFRWEASNE